MMKTAFQKFSLALVLFLLFSFGSAQAAAIDPEVLDAARTQNVLKLKVFLTRQPGHREAVIQKQIFRPQLEALSNQVRDLVQPFVIGQDVIPAVIRDQLKAVNQERDAVLDDMRGAIYAGIKPQVLPQQDRVIRFVAETLGGQVYARVRFVNVLGVEIPSVALDRLANHLDVARISVDRLGDLALNETAPTIGADHLWDYNNDGNLDWIGDGTWDVAVVDTGVQITHPGFFDSSFNPDLNHRQKSGPNFVAYANYSTDLALETDWEDNHGHGTAIAGIVVSTGKKQGGGQTGRKGIAYGIDKVIICKIKNKDELIEETKMWDAVDWALDASRSPYANDHETADIINISLGFKGTNNYSDTAKFLDGVVHDLNVTVTVSAGNATNIQVPGEMYNGITVGNMQHNNDTDRTTDTIHNNSARGPADGRMKPDVVAPGTIISTARRDYATQAQDYGIDTWDIWGERREFTGTSFAAPHAAGAIALLYDYIGGFPQDLKAVLINTADHNHGGNVTTLWDDAYGWGYINLETALTHWWVDSVGLNPSGSSFDQYYWSCTMDNGEKITTVWEREVDYNLSDPDAGDPGFLDNVDLYLYDFTGGVKGAPLGSSTSTVDNVEQVMYNGSNNRQVLVKVINQTSTSTASVSVAFPSGYTRQGHGPFAPPLVATGQSDALVDEVGQNFPNPFNPETWIPYSISKAAEVSIQIFDVNGRLIRQLDFGKKPAGRYVSQEKAAYWDGRNSVGEQVSSGVYFYYLTAGDYAATRKMVIVE